MPPDPDSRNRSHVCRYRADDRGFWSQVKNWWLLPLHFLAALALVLVLLMKVDGHAFLSSKSNDDPEATSSMYQTDVVTLVSVAILVVRLLGAVWLGLAAWRVAFLMLEHEGVRLAELSRVIRFGLPPLDFKMGGFSAWAISIWVIFVLTLPCQLVAPLLTGAIGWNEDIRMTGAEQVLVTQPGNSESYGWHNSADNSRVYELNKALGLSAIAATENFRRPAMPVYRRKVPSLQRYPINSTVENIVMPYFYIEGPLRWITSEEDAGDDIEILKEVAGSAEYEALSFSEAWNPFYQGTDAGRLTIVNTEPWVPAERSGDESGYEYPPATKRSEEKLLAVAVRFENGCKNGSDPSLGRIPQAFMYETYSASGIRSTGKTSSCFIFARFTYTAGAMACKDCRIIADGVVEASKGNSPPTVLEDPLTQQALSMMPEVLFYMKIANISDAPLLDNLDNYAIGMLTVAYQASWNSLANYWSQDVDPATSTLKRPVPVLVATLSKWRAWTWLGLNSLLIVSGILLAILQSHSRAKIVRNPVLAALMLDTSRIIQHDRVGLCNAVAMDRFDSELRLRLVVPEGTREAYRHAYLEVENRRYEQLDQEEESKK